MNCKCCGCEHVEKEENRDVRIVILQRGWVMVGEYSKHPSELEHRCLDKASVIRVWGTTKGLGELIDGPTRNTKLDPCGHVEFHSLTEIANIKVKEYKWNLK